MIEIYCAYDAIADINTLKPNPANPNKHPPEQIALLAKIINAQGWRNPIVVSNRSGLITKGHARLEAARKLGVKMLPIDRQDYASDSEELADMIADNRIAELAEPDRSMLRELMEQLDTGDFDMDLTGFDTAALEELMTAAPPASDIDAEPQIDKADELRQKWGVERGQIWQLGEHRLMCGDCTETKEVSRLIDSENIAAVVTDPPYGIGIKYASVKDTKVNTKALISKLFASLWNLKCPIALTPGVPLMWDYPQPNWVMVWIHPAANGGCEWGFSGTNPILVYGKDPYLANNLGRRQDHIVLAADREGVDGHPTPKPIKVWSWLVERTTVATGLNVYDPFVGSGTTIIACEQLGRKCRAMEIDPGYVAVSIQRYLDATGKMPTLL